MSSLPSFGYIATPEELLSLISNEAMSNGNLSFRGVSRMADVQHTSLVRDGAFSSQKLAEKLTAQGFECGALIQSGFPPVAVILVLEYFAYQKTGFKTPSFRTALR